MANPRDNLKPFKPGQSGNPNGRPKKNIALDAWRAGNAIAAVEAITAEEIHDAWLRWFARFKVGDQKALWMVPYLFGQPPKAAEPKDDGEQQVTRIEIRRLDKDGDGSA